MLCFQLRSSHYTVLQMKEAPLQSIQSLRIEGTYKPSHFTASQHPVKRNGMPNTKVQLVHVCIEDTAIHQKAHIRLKQRQTVKKSSL